MTKLPVPRHLQDCGEITAHTETFLSLRLCCGCGGRAFRVLREVYSEAEEAAMRAHADGWQAATKGCRVRFRKDAQGREIRERKRGLFGRWEPFDCPPCPICADVHVVRADCLHCGREHLVFDSRLHGFDAAEGMPPESRKWQPAWREAACGEVRVEIRNEMAVHPVETPEIYDRYIVKDGEDAVLFDSDRPE